MIKLKGEKKTQKRGGGGESFEKVRRKWMEKKANYMDDEKGGKCTKDPKKYCVQRKKQMIGRKQGKNKIHVTFLMTVNTRKEKIIDVIEDTTKKNTMKRILLEF